MGKVFACGCSFTNGMGLWDYGSRSTRLVADELGYEEVNLSVVGSSNYGVFLQAKYAIEQANKDDIVIISDTSNYRCEFYDDAKAEKTDPNILTIFNIDYSGETNSDPTMFSDDPKYKGDMKMGQYWRDYDGKGLFDFFKKRQGRQKMKTIAEFYTLYHPHRVKVDSDAALYSTLHLYALRKGVKHVMLLDGNVTEYFDADLYADENYLNHSWFTLSEKYPDEQGSMHCNEEAHSMVATRIMDKMRKNKWIV